MTRVPMKRRRVYAPSASAVRNVGNFIRTGYNAYQRYRKYSAKRKAPRTQIRTRKRPQRRLTQKRLKTKIKKFCKFIDQQTAIHIHRDRQSARLIATPGSHALADYDFGGSITSHEAAMANLRYFNPATNTLVTANPAIGLFHRDINMSIFRKLTLTNNYQSRVEIRVYKCHVKSDTSNRSTQLYTSGITDQGTAPTTSPLLYPTDSDNLTDIYSVKQVCKRVLCAGQTCVVTDMQKQFSYDFSVADVHPLLYQRKLGGFQWMVRVEGTLGHDNTAITQIGLLFGGVDLMFDTTYKFQYDAGKDIHEYSVNDQSTTVFTNGAVQSMKPVVDNLGFSQS